jgi:hypothetical protein
VGTTTLLRPDSLKADCPIAFTDLQTPPNNKIKNNFLLTYCTTKFKDTLYYKIAVRQLADALSTYFEEVKECDSSNSK